MRKFESLPAKVMKEVIKRRLGWDADQGCLQGIKDHPWLVPNMDQHMMWVLKNGLPKTVNGLSEILPHTNTFYIHLLTWYNQEELLDSLLQIHPTSVYFQNSYGKTALHIAAAMNHTEAANKLIEYNANLLSTDTCQQTPLHRAAAFGHVSMTEKLFNANKGAACILSSNKHPGTPLYRALSENNIEVSTFLIKESPDCIGIANHDGLTPLHIAAAKGKFEIIQLLLDHGADVNAISTAKCLLSGSTPLDVAINHSPAINGTCPSIVQLLQHSGAVRSSALRRTSSSGYQQLSNSCMPSDQPPIHKPDESTKTIKNSCRTFIIPA